MHLNLKAAIAIVALSLSTAAGATELSTDSFRLMARLSNRARYAARNRCQTPASMLCAATVFI